MVLPYRKKNRKIRASNVERVKTITCPAGYGADQAGRDRGRLHALEDKRLSPAGPLSDADDAEEAQLTARVAAYERTARERRCRERVFELYLKEPDGLTAAEQSEYVRLHALYPGALDPDDPLTDPMTKFLLEFARKRRSTNVKT